MESEKTENSPKHKCFLSGGGGGAGERKRLYGSRTDALTVLKGVDLSGRTFLVTGCNSGIGLETARSLALHGAHVVMANRNIVDSEKLKKEILAEKADAKVDMLNLDLSSLQSVQAAAAEYKRQGWPLDVLVLNAGVFAPTVKATIDGYESSFGVNHLGHFYLTKELLPLLRESGKAGRKPRIVVVSSHSHAHSGISPSAPLQEKLKALHPEAEGGDVSYRRYSKSKLCNVLFAFKLHRDEYEKNGIAVYVLHPGTMIGTNISRGYGAAGKFFNLLTKPFTKTVQQGAATNVYCAAAEEVETISGKYWESCWDDEKVLQKELARDEQLQDALWTFSEQEINKFEAKRRPPQ